MRLILIAGLAIVMAFNTQAQVAVPGSTSPDGTVALYYEHSASAPMNGGYAFYFRNTQSLSHLSGNLVPYVPADLTTTAAIDDDKSEVLFNMIGSRFEAGRSHILWEVGFEYFVAWSPDSRWVSIEGGAHKFWCVMIYHSVEDHFQRIKLPDAQFGEYFDTHKNELHVRDLGVAAAIRKIDAHDQAQVCWLQNGILAISARYQNIYYLVNVSTNPATITGICK
jgi:hypothetical protein